MDKMRRRMIWRNLWTHPGTLLPLTVGALAGIVGLGFGIVKAVLVGFAAVLAGLLVFAWRVTMKQDQIAQQVQDEIARTSRQQTEAALDDLDRRLRESDRDPEPEELLEELRSLLTRSSELLAAGNPVFEALDIRGKINGLFDQCTKDLERTIALHEEATRATGTARRALSQRRTELKKEITASVTHLREVVDGMQNLTQGEAGSHAALRQELDASLRAAMEADATVRGRLTDINDRLERA